MRCRKILFAVFLTLTGDDGREATEQQLDSSDEDNDMDIERPYDSQDSADSSKIRDDVEEEVGLVEDNNTTSNVTIGNGTNVNNTVVQVSCLRSKTLKGYEPVEIVNSTRLAAVLQIDLNVTSRQMAGNCVVVLFYSPSCLFSCQVAPYFNALPRLFPDIKMVALDAMTHRSFNAQYGIFGIPTLMLFHNGRPAARLNETSNYSLEMFAKFIKTCANMEPVRKLVVTSADFDGPISFLPVKERDYYLLLSWTVIVLRILYSVYRSSWGRWLADATLSAWREAEAQHHHID